MLDEAIKTKLRDPGYLDWHLAAIRAIRTVGQADWYDSVFLRRYEVARHYLAAVNPAATDGFTRAFDRLKPPADFRLSVLDALFDAETYNRIIAISNAVADHGDDAHSRYERDRFGRRVIWDHPYFLQLQRDLVPLVSRLAGCELVPRYNFLSLYSSDGVCRVHMDQPVSMYTLDYCIAQSHDWPIHFSKVVEWPDVATIRAFDPEAIKADPDLEFAAHTLQPNQALLFNGSSQWHYRDPIPAGGFCNLLFFHYHPAGCEDLVDPRRWAAHFDIPELGALCDLFDREDRDTSD
jgi:hypothetical protein